MPSSSRDGKRIWFSSDRSGDAVEIWVMDADGGNKRQITYGTPGGNFTPVESPDGTQVAFSSLRVAVGHPEVWIMNADGSKIHPLTDTPVLPGQEYVWSLHPTWSGDGETIAYASTASGSTQIWVMNADGTNQEQLTDVLGLNYPDANVPSWSWDGKQITFWAGFERQYGEVWVMDPDGSNPRRVTETPDPRNSDDPRWSPDGTKIIYGQGQAGVRDMWVIDVSGGEPALFATDIHWCVWEPLPVD